MFGFKRSPSTAGGASTPADRDTELLAVLLDDRLRRRGGRNHPRAGRVLIERLRGAIHRHVGLLQLRDHLEGAVALRPDEIRALRLGGDRRRHRRDFLHELERRVERLRHRIDADAGQHPQRVAGHVVRRLGRSAGEQAQVGIVLDRQHRVGEPAVRLRGLDHERAGRILLAVGAERRGRRDESRRRRTAGCRASRKCRTLSR